ncbi:MAG: winged helix-turn-helix domain-containing protein [Betaproteobacteria bacterium]|nr:winged helix-turn-helix domain-containing protein [Betaproteobacteria bacterium]
MARYRGLTLRIFGTQAPVMGPGKAELVTLIGRTGSISAAARAMGMSYRRAWQLVDALNASFRKPVVVTEVGGRHGGGAQVTAYGRRLVERYRAMEGKASAAIAADLATFTRHVRQPAPKGRGTK